LFEFKFDCSGAGRAAPRSTKFVGGAAGLESMSSFSHANRMAMYIVVKAGGTKGELYRSIEAYMECNGGNETARGYVGVSDI